MTGRRSWWTDELIDAVLRLVPYPCNQDPELDMYAVISTVEDWVVSAHLSGVFTAQWEADRASLQRVRELHKGSPECAYCVRSTDDHTTPHHDHRFIDTCDECCEAMPCATIRALDGPTPEQAADELTRLTEEMGLYEDGAE